MNLWQTFVRELNVWSPGDYVKRRSLKIVLPELHETQIDNFRLHAARAGFLEATDKPGYYILKKRIPASLGWRACMRMGYPKRFKKSRR